MESRARGGGNSLCVDTPGSGIRRRLGTRERAGEAAGDLLSLSHPALGTCSAVPAPSMGCPASLLSLSWGSGGRGRKLASCLWLPEERTRKEAVGTDHQVLGDSPWPLWGMLIHAFLGS